MAAHADPEATFPPAGTSVAEGPSEIWIDLTEPVSLEASEFELRNLSGERIGLGPLERIGPNRLRAEIPGGPLPEDGYVVRWSTLSQVDGHPSSGAWGFAVGAASAPIGHDIVVVPFPVASAGGRALAFGGLAVAVWALAIRWAVLGETPTRAPLPVLRRLGMTGAAVHVVGLLVLLLGELDASRLGLGAYAFGTDFGRGLIVRILAGALLGAAFAYGDRLGPRPEARAEAVLAGMGILGFAFFSHTAAQLAPRWLGAGLDAVHLASVFAWAGGLVAFFAVTHPRFRPKGIGGPGLLRLSLRFSRLAIASIAVLTFTGLIMTLAILGTAFRTWPEQLASVYGLLLVTKVLLALFMVGLGGFNHLLFVRRFLKADAPSVQQLFRYNVRREALNGLLVLAIAGFLTNLSPSSVYAF